MPITWLSASDQTGGGVVCHRVDDVLSDVRPGYWLAKAFNWLEGVDFPP